MTEEYFIWWFETKAFSWSIVESPHFRIMLESQRWPHESRPEEPSKTRILLEDKYVSYYEYCIGIHWDLHIIKLQYFPSAGCRLPLDDHWILLLYPNGPSCRFFMGLIPYTRTEAVVKHSADLPALSAQQATLDSTTGCNSGFDLD